MTTILLACCAALTSTALPACTGSDGPSGGQGGAGGASGGGGGSAASGGTTATGGPSASGGAAGAGGSGAGASAGAAGAGGGAGSGGATGEGGAPAGGEGGAAGAAERDAGSSANGSRDGGVSGDAGAGPREGGSAGGARDASPRVDGGASTTFFVTSRGMGMGGNLGGLAGADAFCKTLATAVSAELGAQTWHAYLSTTTVNARDRIGPGPWRNAAGRLVANNVADLHSQTGAAPALNATWPLGDANVALDERGNAIPASPVVHDILTGTSADGTLAANANCNDWTSQSNTAIAQNGHSNRGGGGTLPTSWSSAHTVGCAEAPAGGNFVAGTVTSGGGRGSIYCFAVP